MSKFVAIYHSAWGDAKAINSEWFAKYGDVVTDIIHFKVDPMSTAPYIKFDSGEGNFTKNQAQIIADAHARNIRVQLCIGGVQSPSWDVITKDANLTKTVVTALGNYCKLHGYDGFNLDWESNVNQDGFKMLSAVLRAELDSWSKRGVLSSAAGRFPNHDITTLNTLYDQIYIMGYDCNGWWSNPGDGKSISGFHEPAHDVSGQFLVNPAEIPFNLDEMDKRWTAAGLDKTKTAFGIAFYGYVWSPQTAPGQARANSQAGLEHYFNIVNKGWAEYYEPLAEQAWSGNPSGAGYCNYNSPLTVQKKIQWMQSKGYEGIMLFANEHAYNVITKESLLLEAVRGNAAPPVETQPSFSINPKNQTVEKGKIVVFSATASGFPSPALSWTRDGVDAGTGNSISFTVTKNETVACTATNSKGSVTSLAVLTASDVVVPPSEDLTARVVALEAANADLKQFQQNTLDIFYKLGDIFPKK